jgi:NADP-dependent aldehyde dehydrogenase
LRERGKELAAAFHASLTAGVGQMCTNPGIVVTGSGPEVSAFQEAVVTLVSGTRAGVMLTDGIRAAYDRGTCRLQEWEGVEVVASGGEGGAFLFETDAERFIEQSGLHEEVFGPSSLMVRYGSADELLRIAESMEGQLTASVHGTEEELLEHRALLEQLERRVGRLIVNGFPTGVEVCHAMVHGGPYPATSDGRSTSIGTLSIQRFVRPVSFQDVPDALLADELKEGNPLGIVRLVDGRWTGKPE